MAVVSAALAIRNRIVELDLYLLACRQIGSGVGEGVLAISVDLEGVLASDGQIGIAIEAEARSRAINLRQVERIAVRVGVIAENAAGDRVAGFAVLIEAIQV